MLDSKYAVKYSFPHTLVHIVDNSRYAGQLPVVIADDPSLYATLVVSGAPMGVNNKMVSINRSDVSNVAFGLGNIDASDVKKYGQSITYVNSLIAQNVPVRFMRVTPDDATYATAIIALQWRVDTEENKLHVRFKNLEWPASLDPTKFQNTARVNEAIKNAIKSSSTIIEDGFTWNQRAFINVISAGKGSAYNNMGFCVNMTNQSRKPGNVAYTFATINNKNSQTVETFIASLVNINNPALTNLTDTLNNIVARRVPGSSVLVPYVNEEAVQELYKDYMTLLKNIVDSQQGTDYDARVLATMNVNIFDVVYGNYIYNGTEASVKLPYYQVDTINSDIVKLGDDKLVDAAIIGNVDEGKGTFQNKIIDLSTGITNINDSVHVGDLYLTSTSSTDNTISIIASINQYTGAVTSITIPKVYPITKVTNNWIVNTAKSSRNIAFCLEELVNSDDLETPISAANLSGVYSDLYNAIVTGVIQDGDIIAGSDGSTFELYLITRLVVGAGNNINVVLAKYPTSMIYFALDRNSHKNLLKGTGNVMAWDYKAYETATHGDLSPYVVDPYEDAVLNMVGYGVVSIDTDANAVVYVNGYDRTADDTNNTNRIQVTKPSLKFGTVPDTIARNEDLVGEKYDVLSYKTSEVTSYLVKQLGAIALSTTSPAVQYAVGDLVSVVIDAATDDPKKFDTTSEDQKSVIYSVLVDDQYYDYTYTLVTEEPVDFDPTQYYKNVDGAWVAGTAGEAWAANTWYTRSETKDQLLPKIYDENGNPIFYKSYNPLAEPNAKYTNEMTTSGSGTNVWDANYAYVDENGGGYYIYSAADGPTPVTGVTYNNGDTTTIIPSTAHTILRVTAVDENGNITGYNYARRTAITNTSDTDPYSLAMLLAADSPTKIKLKKINGYTGDANWAETTLQEFDAIQTAGSPEQIKRYIVSGSLGTLYRISTDPVVIPANYYNPSEYGISLDSENGGVEVTGGSTGFFDDENMNSVEFKWRYSQLLVKAFKGYLDKSIKSPNRVPAMFLFDGAWNTIVGANIVPELTYTPEEIINASTIFTDDEKDAILYDKSIIAGIKGLLKGSATNTSDIDVKAAMYELTVYRNFDGIPENLRPIGQGSGLQLLLDTGYTDDATSELVANSFLKRFNSWNVSFDVGGYTEAASGITYTYAKRIVDNLFNHIQTYTINKPFVGKYSTIPANEFVSYFPDIDTVDWDRKEVAYKSGANVWSIDSNGNLSRQYQRTLYREGDTSDMIQENNSRTLTQLVYLLKNKLNSYLLEYSDDDTLKTMTDDCNIMFSNWIGTRVDGLNIYFERDINPLDGGEVVVCYCDVRFRGLVLRIPTIVNIQRREES